MQDWKYLHHVTGGGKCGTGIIGTNLQGWKMRDQAVMESQTPTCYDTHNMIYLIFFISVLLYYTLQVSFNTMTVLRSAVHEAKHTYQLWHI